MQQAKVLVTRKVPKAAIDLLYASRYPVNFFRWAKITAVLGFQFGFPHAQILILRMIRPRSPLVGLYPKILFVGVRCFEVGGNVRLIGSITYFVRWTFWYE